MFLEIRSEGFIFDPEDDPPSYPPSPVILPAYNVDRPTASNHVQETPPPKYDDWYSNDIFIAALRRNDTATTITMRDPPYQPRE